MSKPTPSLDFLAFIPQAIESHWDNVWAPRLAGFPVNIVYAASIEGGGLARATYVFDPGTLVDGAHSRQMRYRPAIASDFSVLVKLHQDGGIDTFKYRDSAPASDRCRQTLRRVSSRPWGAHRSSPSNSSSVPQHET